MDSKTQQFSDIIILSFSFWSKAQNLIQYVALKRICKQGCGFTLSKTILFLLSHMAQQTALTPVSIKLFSFHLIPCSQVPNIWMTLLGFLRPKVVWIILQINLASVLRSLHAFTTRNLKFSQKEKLVYWGKYIHNLLNFNLHPQLVAASRGYIVRGCLL